jgi:protein-S-isoprenylcysteine O-methyltransferase Ste14
MASNAAIALGLQSTRPVGRIALRPQSAMTIPSLSILGPLWGVSELCVALIKRSRSDAVSKDRGSFFLIWAVCLSSIGLAVLAARGLPTLALPNRKLFYVTGFCFFALGLLLRCYSIIYLGRFFTSNVAIAADHRLIDSGPYRFIRHPTYTGLLMLVFGLGLSFGNLASTLIIVVPILMCLLWRIRIEEQALVEAFGQRYHSYMQRTKRLIPLIY